MGKFKPSINWLYIFIPIALALRFVPGWRNETALFFCSCLAIIPLAGWMGRATEDLASRMGEGVGGLLNATFGNAAELIIALLALSRGLTGVVKASITGSIIGNILLVLGASVLAGGIKFPEQKFNKTAANNSTTSLALAAIALVIPAIFHVTAASRPGGWTQATENRLSLAIAVILFVTYICILLFTLKTHKHHFAGESDGHGHSTENLPSVRSSMLQLLTATIGVAGMSEMLVGSVEAARESLGFSEVFVGVIVVAIVGNAAEHSTAIVTALKNKMDLSIGIAVGSSLQIALFVAPVLVFSSYLFGKPMDLEFTVPEIIAVLGAVYIASQISSDGKSNWLEGVQLLSVYLIMAVLFYYLPDAHQPAH
jgi:Ca2+:H+ antiporter